MLTEIETQQIAEIKNAFHSIPGVTYAHAVELERSLEMVLNALTGTQADLEMWTHFTIVVDKETFENAGYEVSTLTKPILDDLVDAMNDYFVGGKEWKRAIEFAAEGILTRVQAEASDECECCNVEGQFVLDQDGACARCRHEHTSHYGMENEHENAE